MPHVMNKYLVSATGDRILIHNPPRGSMSKDDALLFAAWLVVLAGGAEKLSPVLQAVKAT